jgi:predicted RNA-binding protein YlqC (UPF0109 family)
MDGEQKQTSQAIEIRVLIANNQVGGIIGKGGMNVKRVRDEAGVFLSILKADYRNMQERVMVLKGEPEQVALAFQMVAELLVDAAKADPKRSAEAAAESLESTTLKLLVHRSAAGAVIGKAGAVIKETQLETGTRLQVSNDPLPGSTEKSLSITGPPSAIRAASLRVLHQLLDNPLRPGTRVVHYVPGAPLYPIPPYTMPLAYGQNGAVYPIGGSFVQPPPSTQKIAIPTVCAGSVIGKGGSVIRDLRAQSGTNISIADPEDTQPTERVVTITGSPQGIQTAIYLIRNLVEQFQPTPGTY